jgi:hypothetical protein
MEAIRGGAAAGAVSAIWPVAVTVTVAGGSMRLVVGDMSAGGRGGLSGIALSWMADKTSTATVVAVPAIIMPFEKRLTSACAVTLRRSFGQPTIHILPQSPMTWNHWFVAEIGRRRGGPGAALRRAGFSTGCLLEPDDDF